MTTLTKDAPMAATVTTPGDREVQIERVFNAKRERVWRAMTDPKLLAQWWDMLRSHPRHRTIGGLRRGGHWRFVEQTPVCGPQGF